ncbi:MAG: GNAT family protein [Bacilli bacterium]|nr:GNAT family protein [Bacilli bacterium]
MKYFKKIEGEKVYLSPMNLEDIEKYVKWMNDFSTTDGLGSSSKVTTFESERSWLINNMDKAEQQFAIVLKETDKLIGNCGFVDINHLHQKGEVGLFIGEEENRSKGYGTEALSLLVEYGFNYLNLKNIMLKVFSFNKRAIKSYEKIGFKVFGKRTEVYYLNGKWYDEYFMEILRKEK